MSITIPHLKETGLYMSKIKPLLLLLFCKRGGDGGVLFCLLVASLGVCACLCVRASTCVHF